MGITNITVTKLALSTKTGKNTVGYEYNRGLLLNKVTLDDASNVNYNYDSASRLNKITFKNSSNTDLFATEYKYYQKTKNGETYHSTLLHRELSSDFSYKYDYDANGNITCISNVTVNADSSLSYTPIEEYTYDRLNQLTSVNYLDRAKRYVYTYNQGGNITRAAEYDINDDGTYTLSSSKAYTYGDMNWQDLMTKYAGQTITYDAIGNPLNYRDGMTMTWSQGRKLSTLNKDNTDISYTYDNSGLRLTKTVNGVKHTYLYENNLLVQEVVGNNSKIYDFSYTPTGQPLSVRYTVPYMHQTSTYYYYCNSRGDVIGLYNSNGTLHAKYTYDVWGNTVSVNYASGAAISDPSSFANTQPLRYRGYYFDTESGLYYLQSRYYDPVTGRFINTDGLVSTGTGIIGHNMFAYCNNNPVNKCDPSGTCFYDAKGNWCHDNWEYFVGYERKPNPEIKAVAGLSLHGKPNSKDTSYNPNGTKKQERWYGPDGLPIRDRDYNHSGNVEFPHDHEWVNGDRQNEHLPPDPSYTFSWDYNTNYTPNWEILENSVPYVIGGLTIFGGIMYMLYTGDPSLIQQGASAFG